MHRGGRNHNRNGEKRNSNDRKKSLEIRVHLTFKCFRSTLEKCPNAKPDGQYPWWVRVSGSCSQSNLCKLCLISFGKKRAKWDREEGLILKVRNDQQRVYKNNPCLYIIFQNKTRKTTFAGYNICKPLHILLEYAYSRHVISVCHYPWFRFASFTPTDHNRMSFTEDCFCGTLLALDSGYFQETSSINH